ncbi:MAG: bifunctional hydroxymethylpyrimidine kinase/phosphomethylpyrimidine kinase [Gammaproteobacteria bacterium]
MNPHRPVVICFSGHDPSGGAGVQADIETLVSHQCHAGSVITALTEQDTDNVVRLFPQTAEAFLAQAQTLLKDITPAVFKIGLIGDAAIAEAIRQILIEHAQVPVVLDPILAAGGGAVLAGEALVAALKKGLLPLTTILTPNSIEVRKLVPEASSPEQGAQALLDKGCGYVLITGTHEATAAVTNKLFYQGKCIETYTWDRLPGSYHGSGCTLATAIAAMLAHGLDMETAVLEAQEYTWNTLEAGYRPGGGQHVPNRFFWMQED